MVRIRGGATTDDDDGVDEEEEEDDVDESEDEEAEVIDSTLTASAVKAAVKTKAKKTTEHIAATKRAVNSKLTSLQKTEKRKASGGVLKSLKVPYIVRAFLNPVTLWKMTVCYWASLFNLDYLKQVRHYDKLWKFLPSNRFIVSIVDHVSAMFLTKHNAICFC